MRLVTVKNGNIYYIYIQFQASNVSINFKNMLHLPSEMEIVYPRIKSKTVNTQQINCTFNKMVF